MATHDNATILVTGASGFIGASLCSALSEKGHDVVALSRAPARAKLKLPRVKQLAAWQPTRELISPSTLYGVNAVVHLVGETIAGKWNAQKKARIEKSRLGSTQLLVESLSKADKKPDVLVCASAIGYYGEGGDKTLTEDSPPGDDFLATLCQAWEVEAKKAETLGIRTVQVRIGLVLGKEGGLLRTMLTPFKMGLGGRLGDGKQWMSWIHLDDVVGIIMHALKTSQISGPLNATAPEPKRNINFTKSLGYVLKRPTIFPVPTFALKIRFGDFTDFTLMSQRVIPQKSLSAGYAFRHPDLENALRVCLA